MLRVHQHEDPALVWLVLVPCGLSRMRPRGIMRTLLRPEPAAWPTKSKIAPDLPAFGAARPIKRELDNGK